MKRVSLRSGNAKVRTAFFALKACNTAIAASQTFVTIFVLIRVLPQNVYSSSLLIVSIAMYVMATDLGYSGYIYATLRRQFFQDLQFGDRESLSQAFTLYLAISVGAAILVGTSILIFADMDLKYRAGLAVYFSSAVAALPWMLLRRIAAAIDLFLEFELLEFCRRVAFLFLSLAMLLGLGLLSFAVLCMLTWLLAFLLAFRRLNRNSLKLRLVLLPSAFAHARDNFPNIAQTGAFTLLEFAILNFPYILVSNQFSADSLIAFDVFFKLTRLSQFAYSVPVETMLPSQTAAFHGKDRRAVITNFFRVFALGSLALMPLAAIILAFGDELFRLLLKREDYVDAELRFTMVVMLSATLVQMSAGMLLTGTGRYTLLLKSTLVTSSLMAGLAAATVCLQISFIQFMIAYVLVYSMHAMLFLSCFLLTIPAQQMNDRR